MASIETLISQYWMIIFSILIVLFIALIFLVRMVSKKKQKKTGIPDINKKEKASIFSTNKSPESEVKKDDQATTSEIPIKHLIDPKLEAQISSERRKINSWADFVIEIDNLTQNLEGAKAHEYFKMSQLYRELTRYYFDNIQNPNIGKADMDNAWKRLEACYSKIQRLLENI